MLLLTLEFAVDAQVVASEGSSADDGYTGCSGSGHLLQRGFDGLAAPGVELEEAGDLVFRLGGGGCDEAGRAGALGANVGVGGDELEQVERDVFRTACGGECGGFHELDGSKKRVVRSRWSVVRGGMLG